MHTGQIRTLAAVVDFFDRAGDGPGMDGTTELEAGGLTNDEKQDLVNFMLSLAGPGPYARLLTAP